ncbi:MAG: sugar phosphate nucleotidyltransferase [Flavobacteriales bacterium]|jgi:glucose-1-phosphate thymidylyltransferase
MKIIVPMAGMGKRLRPHTLTTPKPLLPIAGKPIVQRLVEDIVAISDQKVEEIAYVVGRFGEAAEKHLISVAESLGAKGTIHYQDEALGTAHAILCAASALEGPVTVAFADTLFRADFKLDTTKDGVLWVQKIEDPRQFGVVIVNDEGVITEFKEKPQEFVSDLAMIGIYYFKDGARLRAELQYLIDNNITNSGEYQLPDALRNMVKKGAQFAPGTVSDWMDCGNKDAMIDTNKKVLGYIATELSVPSSAKIENAVIIPPCFIGAGVTITNAVIGPFTSVGDGASINNSVVNSSIVLPQSKIEGANLVDSMIGVSSEVRGSAQVLSLSDYSVVK